MFVLSSRCGCRSWGSSKRIWQLLTQKKLPPAPDRTDIYEKMGRFLRLSNGELATLARAQRMDALRRDYEEPQGALLKETRELILQKCLPARQQQIRTIFERQPFGELEQLVTQTLLDVISRVTRVELDNEDWLRAGPHRGKEAKGALVT
jgi:hypothetical protein